MRFALCPRWRVPRVEGYDVLRYSYRASTLPLYEYNTDSEAERRRLRTTTKIRGFLLLHSSGMMR